MDIEYVDMCVWDLSRVTYLYGRCVTVSTECAPAHVNFCLLEMVAIYLSKVYCSCLVGVITFPEAKNHTAFYEHVTSVFAVLGMI